MNDRLSREIHDLKKLAMKILKQLEEVRLYSFNPPKSAIDAYESSKELFAKLTEIFPEHSYLPTNPEPLGSGVLIDDEKTYAINWNLIGNPKGFHVVHYSSHEDFIKEQTRFERETFIYVDWYIDLFTDSLEFTKQLFDLGFKNIIITTNAPGLDVSDMPWIKRIIDKSPPWSK